MNALVRRATVLLSIFAVSLLLTACATGGSRRGQYNEICQDRQEPGAQGVGNDPARHEKETARTTDDVGDARVSPDPKLYLDGGKAQDIAQARRRLLHVRRDYERFECQQEISNRNVYDRPLLATAIVATAAALAKANAYIIGGIGLTAGGIAAFKSYNHPDSDRDAFLTAYAQLTCAYDETHSLALNVGIDKMTYDRDAVQIAIAAVSNDIAPLTGDQSNLTAQQKAVLTAANAAIAAGNKAIDNTNQALSDYNRISTIIYKTVDSIDITARTVNKTNGTNTSFTSSLKDAYAAAGQIKAATDDAKKKVDTADAAQKAAGMLPATAPAAGKKLSINAEAARRLTSGNSNLLAGLSTLKFQSSCKSGAPADICDQVTTDSKGIATNTSTNAQLPASQILSDNASGDISKLVSLAALATNNMPSPSYADIIAAVTACVPKS
jgi:hypothetical protein